MLQITFLVLAFAGPVLIWKISRRIASASFDDAVCRATASILVVTQALEFCVKVFLDHTPLRAALPMHLCDWTLLAAAAALWFRWQTCFEVAYFWGLAGSVQALITPAISPDAAVWRKSAFFLAHAGVVAGVLFLVLALRMRPMPRSLLRVFIWSEIYLGAALLTNALTGENYGFLAHRPPTRSMLDWFSDTPWLYVAEINGTALLFFAALYLPWWLADRRRANSTRHE